MAILIPSKNIYNKNNPKVRDNVVDNVTVNQTIVSPNNEYDVSLINQTTNLFTTGSWQRSFKLIGNMNSSLSYYVQEAVGVGIKYEAVENYTITIPKAGINKYISSISLGLDNNGNPKVKSTIHYTEKIGNLPISVRHNKAPNITASTSIYPVKTEDVTVSYSNPSYTQTNENLVIERINSADLTLKSSSAGIEGLSPISASVSVSDFTNLGSKNILTEDSENYYLKVSVICGYEKFEVYDQVINYNPISLLNSTQTINATATKIEPVLLEITVYGNTIGIDLKDGTVNIYSGNKPFSLNSNELLQDSGTVGGKSIARHLGLNVYNQYKKGKETAKILCNISDYYLYGEKETKAKSITSNTDMVFHQNDQVIPMVLGADGQDRPMSSDSNGNPKVFTVVGTNIIYDGAVWQEITLQEYNN